MITMMIKLYITTFIYFIIIDLIGISFFVRKVYEKNLPKDVKLDFNIPRTTMPKSFFTINN